MPVACLGCRMPLACVCARQCSDIDKNGRLRPHAQNFGGVVESWSGLDFPQEKIGRTKKNGPLDGCQRISCRFDSSVEEEADRPKKDEAGMDNQADKQWEGVILWPIERPEENQTQRQFEAPVDNQKLGLPRAR